MAAEVKSSPATEPKVSRPEKPNDEAYKAALATAEKEHAAVLERLNAIKAKIDLAKPTSQDSPTAKKQQELRAQLSSIRQKQQGFKASRGPVLEKLNALDTTLKSRIAEQKNARGRIAYKSVDEIDREIQRLEKQVDSGTMKLVDEKKNLAEISNLRKQRKGFAGFDDAQKGIDDIKSQISSLKKSLDNPEVKALSDQYTTIQKELDALKADQDGAFKNLNSLRDQRTKIHAEQQQTYAAIREVKDNHYKARKAYKKYEDEAYRIRQERQKAERAAFEREKRRKVADKKFEEASRPAYTDEILTAQGLIRHFEPSYDFSALGLDADKKQESAAYRAEVGRTVDDSNMKGVKVLKKDDRDDEYFVGAGKKKGKKGKKAGASASTTPAEGKFNLSAGVIEDLSQVKVDPPMNQSDVPSLVESLAAKITKWKAEQPAKTAENIKKAQEEIDRLEKENASEAPANDDRATDDAKKPALENAGIEGHVSADAELKQEKDAAADATEELKKASLEDKE